jgi:hypothetical protein
MSQSIMRGSTGALLIVILSASSLSAAEPTDPTKNYMGINLCGISDFQGDNAFVDIMKQARSWQKFSWVAGQAAQDSDHWPTEDCSNVIFGVDNALGVYKLVFEGKAQKVNMMWSGGSVANLSYNAATNTSTADVILTDNATGGLSFQGTQRTAASATNTGIRNVRLYRPGYPTDGSVVFANEWLTIIRKFHAIRFMDWMMTNTNPLVSWNQRLSPLQAQPSDNGATINGRTGPVGNAMEHFVQLCNAANADMWINMPSMVDDDYVTKTAQLILYGSDGRNPYTSPQANPVYPPLNPNLKVYVEYGNEIWNSAAGFQCMRWIKTITDSINAATGNHPIVFDGVRDQYTSIARFAAWKTVGVSTIFRGVFGDAAMMARARPVLMGQLGGNWFNPRQLPWLEAFYSTARPSTDPYPNTNPKPVSYHIYASGGSGYYGVYNWSPDPNTFFAGGNYPDSSFAQQVTSDALWAANYGLKRIGYEGGMSLDGGDNVLTNDQKLTLNADPRMKGACVAYQDIWSSCSGDLLMYFNDVSTNNPTWEMTNSVYNPHSPKLQAIDKLRDTLSRAALALGKVAPCTTYAVADKPSSVWLGGGYPATASGESVLDGIDTGEWVAYPVRAPAAGWYRLSVRCGSGSGTATADLYLNGIKLKSCTAGKPLVTVPYVTVRLNAGLNVVRYQPASGNSYLASIMLAHSDTAVGIGPALRRSAGLKTAMIAVKSASGAAVAQVPGWSGDEGMFAVFNAEGRCVTKGMMGERALSLTLPRLARGVYVLRAGSARALGGNGVSAATAMVLR